MSTHSTHTLRPFQKSIGLHAASAIMILLLGLKLYSELPNHQSSVQIDLSVHSSTSIPVQKFSAKKNIAHATTRSISTGEEKSENAIQTQSSAATSITTEMSNYLAKVRQEIENRKHYPMIARLKKLEGQNSIGFIIDPMGNILNLRLTQSSGSALLDQATISLLQTIGNFGPIPASASEKEISLTVPVTYQLND